jgi:hypothetical protein
MTSQVIRQPLQAAIWLTVGREELGGSPTSP